MAHSLHYQNLLDSIKFVLGSLQKTTRSIQHQSFVDARSRPNARSVESSVRGTDGRANTRSLPPYYNPVDSQESRENGPDKQQFNNFHLTMGLDVVAPRTTRDGDDDESAPLVNKSSKTTVVSVTRRHSWTVVVVALAAVATTTLMVLNDADDATSSSGLGKILNWVFTGHVRPEVTFTLDATWIDSRVRAANADFFMAPISDAWVVRHNYQSHLFFPRKNAVKMTRIGLRKWTVTTRRVNYEYGFMLGNENGDTLREVGPWYRSDLNDFKSPSEHMDNCTVTFGQYRNRLIPQKRRTDNIKACFAACLQECERPNAPTPLASLDGSQYTGGNTWGNSKITCNLGSQTTYNEAEQAMHINGNRESVIVCPYEIGPERYPQLTMEVVFKLDSDYDPTASYGWIFGHDDGDFDRSFIISDARFGGGVSSGIGSVYNSGAPTPSNGVWHHGLAVFRQGVVDGSYTALDGVISPVKATANNNEGEPNFSIGGLVNDFAFPHEMKGLIRYFNFYDGALSEDQVEAMYVRNTPWP